MGDRNLEIILTAKDLSGKAFTGILGRVDMLKKSVLSLSPLFIGGAIVYGLQRMVTGSLDAADSIGKVAGKVGLATDSLQELRYAANLAGVGADTLDMAMQRLSRRVGEAAQGKGELIGTLQQYGIAVRDAEGKTRSTEAVLLDLADAIAGAGSEQERLRIAFKAFDSEGAALVGMLKNGGAALDTTRRKARELGMVIEESLIRDAEKAKDRLSTLTHVIGAKLTAEVIRLAPQISEITEQLIELAPVATKAAGAFISLLDVILRVGTVVASGLHDDRMNEDLEDQIGIVERARDEFEKLGFVVGDLGIDSALERELHGFTKLDQFSQKIESLREKLAASAGGSSEGTEGGGPKPKKLIGPTAAQLKTVNDLQKKMWDEAEKMAEQAAAAEKSIREGVLADNRNRLAEQAAAIDAANRAYIESVEKAAESEKQLLADRMTAYRELYSDMKTQGENYWAWQAQVITAQAEQYRTALAGQKDAEALVTAWRASKMRELAEERWTTEHEAMDALRETWGLTFEEIRQGGVNAWQDIGAGMAAVSTQAGNALVDIAMGAKSAKEAGKELLTTLANQTVSTLIQIGMQQLLLSVVGESIQVATTAAMTASMAAIAAAAAPAAMLTSIATAGAAPASGAAAFMAAMAAMTTATTASNITSSFTAGAFGKGAIVTRPTLAWVGEEGDPEAIIPLGAGRRREAEDILRQIAPVFAGGSARDAAVLMQPEAAAGGRSGGDIIANTDVHFYGPVTLDADMDTVRRTIGRAVTSAVRGAFS